MYFDYPLEQGLRPPLPLYSWFHGMYFDYPLEQGLRRVSLTLIPRH